MQAILGLIEHHRLRTVDDIVGDLLTAMSRQAVHHERIARGALQNRLVDLKILEVALPLRRFLLLSHRGPGVGVNHVGVLDRLDRIAGDDAELLAPHPIGECLLRLVARRARDAQLEPAERRRLNPALRHVESVAKERDANFLPIGAVALAHREQIGEQLARMQQVAEPIDDRHARLMRHLDCRLMREGANHDEVDGAREIARDVFHRFALADADVTGREIDRMATELRHAGFEGDASSQRWLLKNHRESFAAQVRMLEADFQFGLEPRRQREQPVEFVRCERGEIEEIAFHDQCPGVFGIGASFNARSMIARPASASARERFSGGSKRSTVPPVPLTMSRCARHASTTGLGSCLSTTPMIMPSPRTSATRSIFAVISFSRFRMYAPISVAFAMTPPSSASFTASAAAHATGLPPKVVP